MFRLTLAQMRRSLGRLVAAGIAIAIGTGFVTATFLAAAALQQGTNDSVTAQFAHADLVVARADQSEWTAAQAARAAATVGGVPGVAGVASDLTRSVTVRKDGAADPVLANLDLTPTTSVTTLRTYGIATGRAPAADHEIALSQSVADRLGVAVGSRVTTVDTDLSTYSGGDGDQGAEDLADAAAPGETGSADALNTPVTWTVVGIVDDPHHAHAMDGIPGLVTPGGLDRFSPVTRAVDGDETTVVAAPWATNLLVSVQPGADPDQVARAVTAADPTLAAISRADAADKAISAISDGQNIFTAFILGFAGLALVVAALVIANTFQVIVAQRRRTLALLRCSGASAAQLRRSVLLEASILGLAASAAGFVLGTGLVQGGLLVAGRLDVSVPLPEVVSFSLVSILVPVVVGTLVTVLACLLPAREATRVPPLAALRPAEPIEARSRAGLVRMVFSGLLGIGGAVLLIGALLLARVEVLAGLLVGIVGGAASFVGIVLAAVFWLPPVARRVGALVSRSGPAARLATANAVRNPRRIAATSTALLIGVTLVTMMSVGATSARSSLDGALDETYPVDAVVDFGGDPGSAAVQAATTEVTTVSGVAAAVAVPVLGGGVVTGDGRVQGGGEVAGLSPDQAERVMHDGSLRGLTDGTLLISPRAAKEGFSPALRTGETVHLGDASGPQLTVRVHDMAGSTAYVTPATMAKLPTGTSLQWRTLVAFSSGASASDVVDRIDDALAATQHWTTSPAAERQLMEQVIDTILAVVVGLLAVAVLIALIGVANTLALSVLERRRESATLRAIGLSKRQLRSMLAVEGAFIAGVGAVLGVVLGLLYGWAGSWVVLNVVGDVHLTVPWRDVAVVIAVALVAGLIASVAPARSATRTSPVEALAVE